MNSNDTRKMIKYMRGKATPQTESKKIPNTKDDLSVRDMLSITRNKKINESELPMDVPQLDQKNEEEKMNNFFRGTQATIEYDPLILFRNAVMFSGTIDGVIQFTFEVTPDDQSSDVNLEFSDDFNESDPENQEIVNKLNAYYDEFYKYWRDEKLNL